MVISLYSKSIHHHHYQICRLRRRYFHYNDFQLIWACRCPPFFGIYLWPAARLGSALETFLFICFPDSSVNYYLIFSKLVLDHLSPLYLATWHDYFFHFTSITAWAVTLSHYSFDTNKQLVLSLLISMFYW